MVDGHLFMASLVGIRCFNQGVWAFPDSVGQTTKHFAVGWYGSLDSIFLSIGFFLAVKICQTPIWFMWPSITWSYFSIQYLEKYSKKIHHSILECPSVKNNSSIEDLISCRTWSNRAGGPCCRWRGESSIYQAPQQCFSFLEWWSLSFNTYYRIL